jgi:hypothetical protein
MLKSWIGLRQLPAQTPEAPRKTSLTAVCIFYVLAYIIVYFANFLVLAEYVYLNLFQRLMVNAALTSLLFLGVYFISKQFVGFWDLRMIGFKRENFVKSLLLASAVLTPIQIFIVVEANLVGVNSFTTRMAIPWLSPPYQPWLPMYTIVLWLLSGLISFSIFQAFPHSLLKNYRYSIIAIAVLWVGLYNAPLLTGQFLVEDILLLGILFLVVYHYTKNALGLIIIYVLAYEGPILWTIGVAWGTGALLLTLYARMIWCTMSALMLIGHRLMK